MATESNKNNRKRPSNSRDMSNIVPCAHQHRLSCLYVEARLKVDC